MRKLKIIKKNKYLILSLLFSFFNLLTLWFLFGWQTDVDTGSYLEAMTYFIKGDTQKLNDIPHRALRPLGIILALPFTRFFSTLTSLIIENVIFYFAAAFLIFKIAKEILKKDEQAFYSVVLYLSAYPMLRFGPVALTDMGAWFFYLLSIYLTLLFLREPRDYLVYLNGLLSGLGVLIKENGGMGILFFVVLLLISRRFQLKEIINYGLKFLLVFVFPILVNQLIIYYYFNYTYFNWYLKNTKTYLKQSYTLFNLAKNFFIVFGIGWIFVFLGIWNIWQEKNEENNRIFLALLIPSLSFFLWPSITARLIYIAGSFLSLVGAKGLGCVKINKKILLLSFLLSLSVIFNFILVKLSYIF